MTFPAVLLLIFGIVQGGLWYHGRNVAAMAAAEGLRAAQAIDGTPAAGQLRASATLSHAGAAGFLRGTSVAADRGQRTASVTVSGAAVALFPALRIPIRVTATGPVEHLLETP